MNADQLNSRIPTGRFAPLNAFAMLILAALISTPFGVAASGDPNLSDPNLSASEFHSTQSPKPCRTQPCLPALDPSSKSNRIPVLAQPEPEASWPARAPSAERGLAFEDLPNQTLFVSFGLRPGDRLESFNGLRLDASSDREDLARRAEQSARARLELNRAGKPLTLNVIRQR